MITKKSMLMMVFGTFYQIAFCQISPPCTTATISPPFPVWVVENDPNWHLVWEDEFNGSAVNTGIWKVSNENDHYGDRNVDVATNVSVSGGRLHLAIRKETKSCDPANVNLHGCYHQYLYNIPYEYTTGSVHSREFYNVHINSYVEAKIKLPYDYCYWNSFWLYLGDGCSRDTIDYCEIDIFEMLGSSLSGIIPPHITGTNTHVRDIVWPEPDMTKYRCIYINGDLTSYEDVDLIYGVKWEKDFITWYINGNEVEKKPNVGQTQPQRIVFGTSLTQDHILSSNPPVYYCEPDLQNLPDEMSIEYVKVYHYGEPNTASSLKPPYVINPGRNTLDYQSTFNLDEVRILWQLDETIFANSNGTCKIEYGPTTEMWQFIDNIPQHTNDHLYKVNLRALMPQAPLLYFRVSVNGLSNQPFPDTYTLRSLPAVTSNQTRFYAYGGTNSDTYGGQIPHHEDVCDAILDEIDADTESQTFLLHTGNWNSANNETNWTNEYFRSLDVRAAELRSKVALMGAKGWNEEQYDIFDSEYTFMKYLPFPFKSNYNTGSHYNYYFNYGPVHVIVLEITGTGFEIPQATIDWLHFDLTNNAKTWNVLVFNSPVKTLNTGLAGHNTISQIKQIAAQYGVQLVLMGSEPYYAHWVENGTHYLTLGSGGNVPGELGLTKLQSEDELFAATVPHFAKFDVQGDFMYVDVIQGKDYLGYQKGRRIERFAIPVSTSISTSMTYSNVDYPLTSDILKILPNVTFTLTAEAHLARAGKIVVEKGGRFTIDGVNAKITTKSRDELVSVYGSGNQVYYESDNMWQGIYLEGNPSENQTYPNKGVVELKNEAMIENAKVGISTMPLSGSWIGMMPGTGGIIEAEDAIFRNCEYAVRMYPYKNYLPSTGKIIKDLSSFRQCSFETTAELQEPGLKPQAFIWLDGINHLNILGCTLRNTSNESDYALRGKGIECFNSNINVNEYCGGLSNPCNPVKSIIQGLECGIWAANYLANVPLTIHNAGFEDNSRGVYLSGINEATVTKNTFKVLQNNITYGLYLDHCTGYTVEENEFENGSSIAPDASIGMIINKSGADFNQIYNNRIENLTYGVFPQGNNIGKDKLTGLKIKCNDFSNVTTTDIAILGLPVFNKLGISEHQGANTNEQSPAGNTFSWSGQSLYSDIYNMGSNIKRYYHHDIQGTTPAPGENWVPKYYNPTKVFLSEVTGKDYISKETVCPTNIGDNALSLSGLYSKMSTEVMNLQSAKLVRDIYKDGGMTNLPEQVELAYPWETYVMFNSLMLESPYLSEQTLIAAINNIELLPDLLLKLILVANPQCTRSEEVMLALAERQPPLPQYMIDEIMMGADLPSPLEDLEATVSYYTSETQYCVNQLKTIYLNDSINDYAADSLMAVLSRDAFLGSKYEKAFLLLSQQDYDGLNDWMTAVEGMLDGEDYENTQYAEYSQYLNILSAMRQEEIPYEELTAQQKEDLLALAETGEFFPAAYARAMLLRHVPEFSYEEPIYLPVIQSQRKRNPIKQDSANEDVTFSVFPNPAKEYVIVEYKLTESDLDAVIKITDSKGVLIKQYGVKQAIGQQLIDCNSVPPGLYNFTLITRRNKVISKKVSVLK